MSLFDRIGGGTRQIYNVLNAINSGFSPGANPVGDPNMEALAGDTGGMAAKAAAARNYQAARAQAVQNGAKWYNMDALAAPAAQQGYDDSIANSVKAVQMLKQTREQDRRQSSWLDMINSITDPEAKAAASADPQEAAKAILEKKFSKDVQQYSTQILDNGTAIITNTITGEHQLIKDPNAVKGGIKVLNLGGKDVIVNSAGQPIAAFERTANPQNTVAGLTPGQIQQSNKFREEYDNLTKDYRKSRDAYNTIQSLSKDASGANDYALIYAFNHLIEPSSVVRETEFANTQNIAGLERKLQVWTQRLQTGEQLTSEMRQEIVNTSHKLLGGVEPYMKQQKKKFADLATAYQIPLNLVGLQDYDPSTQNTDSQAPPQGGPTRVKVDAQGNVIQ
jgi:hypothetical protein